MNYFDKTFQYIFKLIFNSIFNLFKSKLCLIPYDQGTKVPVCLLCLGHNNNNTIFIEVIEHNEPIKQMLCTAKF